MSLVQFSFRAYRSFKKSLSNPPCQRTAIFLASSLFLLGLFFAFLAGMLLGASLVTVNFFRLTPWSLLIESLESCLIVWVASHPPIVVSRWALCYYSFSLYSSFFSFLDHLHLNSSLVSTSFPNICYLVRRRKTQENVCFYYKLACIRLCLSISVPINKVSLKRKEYNLFIKRPVKKVEG